MWAEAVLEIEPVGSNDANIVWEWHIWDHLVQDVDPELPNYGVVSDHPELQDVNYGTVGSNGGPGGSNADWKHFNAIAYNEELDQIALSSRHHDEIYIIDHSTTTEEASGHTGGNSGMGGDYLYRWGNPMNYGRGTSNDQKLKSQHGVHWIPDNFPGGGNLLIFNNNKVIKEYYVTDHGGQIINFVKSVYYRIREKLFYEPFPKDNIDLYIGFLNNFGSCLLYTSDAADE